MRGSTFIINISSIIISLVFLAAFYLLMLRFDTFLKYKATNDCRDIARFEKVDTKSEPGITYKISYPLKEVYDDCLKRIK